LSEEDEPTGLLTLDDLRVGTFVPIVPESVGQVAGIYGCQEYVVCKLLAHNASEDWASVQLYRLRDAASREHVNRGARRIANFSQRWLRQQLQVQQLDRLTLRVTSAAELDEIEQGQFMAVLSLRSDQPSQHEVSLYKVLSHTPFHRRGQLLQRSDNGLYHAHSAGSYHLTNTIDHFYADCILDSNLFLAPNLQLSPDQAADLHRRLLLSSPDLAPFGLSSFQ
jgi:hypothetical protein